MTIKIVIYFSIMFFLSELILMITKRSKKRELKTRNDKKSLILFWISIPLSLSIGFFTANYQKWNLLNQSIALMGISVVILGIMIRWISIIQLKKEFTVDVVILANHQLKTDGLYKRIRHPSYLGLLLICFGLFMSMNSIISLFVITIPVLLAIIYRIKLEEIILMKEIGEPYKDYMTKTYKIIPKLY